MPLTYQHGSLLMEWCLDCHRQPERFVRPTKPTNEVYNMDWRPPVDQLDKGRELVKKNDIQSLTNCSTCHR
jgi:formate-dependent nitrite reductase cytochrome c552 subunit